MIDCEWLKINQDSLPSLEWGIKATPLTLTSQPVPKSASEAARFFGGILLVLGVHAIIFFSL